MYAVEFQADIENGVVRIPKEYKNLQEKQKVKFVVIYDDSEKYKHNTKNLETKVLPNGFLNPIKVDSYSNIASRDELYDR